VQDVQVIGIDPGLTRTGYAIVRRRAGSFQAVVHGVLQTAPVESPAARLASLRAQIAAVLSRHRPDVAAVERLFFNSNVRTAVSVGQASGVVLATAAEHGLEVATYTPTEVKQSVVGFGGATKKQVGSMVASMLGLAEPPRPPDAADACALAICHLNRSGLTAAVRRALA
jgi:crossover junction endodeoxyribonuclease RuvC